MKCPVPPRRIHWWLPVLIACAGPLTCFAQRSSFDILKGDEVVGSIAASRTITGDRILYVMSSYSVMDILWKQVVSTAVVTEYVGGGVRSCMSSVHVNGEVRDSSRMVPDEEGHRCYVHPRRSFHRNEAASWTSARMYYEEPVGQERVFVESVLAMCILRTTAPGRYSLTFPNGAENHYVYREGELQEIHVDRALFDLVFKRN